MAVDLVSTPKEEVKWRVKEGNEAEKHVHRKREKLSAEGKRVGKWGGE